MSSHLDKIQKTTLREHPGSWKVTLTLTWDPELKSRRARQRATKKLIEHYLQGTANHRYDIIMHETVIYTNDEMGAANLHMNTL